MNKRINTKTFFSVLGLAAALSLGSCSDWTENEPVNINQPNLEQDYPEQYAQYLNNLKAYKKGEHKMVYVSFDNSDKVAFTRANHLTTLPDSIDVVSLMYPDELSQYIMDEMEEIRTIKGTKVIYNIDYADFEKSYLVYSEEAKDALKAESEETKADENGILTFAEYVTQNMEKLVPLCDKYNYDGIMISYMGKEQIHMTDEEKEEYQNNQSVFINPIKEWRKKNSDKLLVFCGRAHNLIEKELLLDCKNIIIPSQFELSIEGVERELRNNLREGVPTDRFVVAVQTPSFNKDDTSTGYFAGMSSIAKTSYWMQRETPDYTKAGMMIFNVQNDYYNKEKVFKYTREAINTIN